MRNKAVDANLRLSAQRALLGSITPNMRLIKVFSDGGVITLTVISAAPLSTSERADLSIAASEIVADFPDCSITEKVIIDATPIPLEDVLAAGWVYRRAE
jgi:hypothetical protein